MSKYKKTHIGGFSKDFAKKDVIIDDDLKKTESYAAYGKQLEEYIKEYQDAKSDIIYELKEDSDIFSQPKKIYNYNSEELSDYDDTNPENRYSQYYNHHKLFPIDETENTQLQKQLGTNENFKGSWVTAEEIVSCDMSVSHNTETNLVAYINETVTTKFKQIIPEYPEYKVNDFEVKYERTISPEKNEIKYNVLSFKNGDLASKSPDAKKIITNNNSIIYTDMITNGYDPFVYHKDGMISPHRRHDNPKNPSVVNSNFNGLTYYNFVSQHCLTPLSRLNEFELKLEDGLSNLMKSETARQIEKNFDIETDTGMYLKKRSVGWQNNDLNNINESKLNAYIETMTLYPAAVEYALQNTDAEILNKRHENNRRNNTDQISDAGKKNIFRQELSKVINNLYLADDNITKLVKELKKNEKGPVTSCAHNLEKAMHKIAFGNYPDNTDSIAKKLDSKMQLDLEKKTIEKFFNKFFKENKEDIKESNDPIKFLQEKCRDELEKIDKMSDAEMTKKLKADAAMTAKKALAEKYEQPYENIKEFITEHPETNEELIKFANDEFEEINKHPEIRKKKTADIIRSQKDLVYTVMDFIEKNKQDILNMCNEIQNSETANIDIFTKENGLMQRIENYDSKNKPLTETTKLSRKFQKNAIGIANDVYTCRKANILNQDKIQHVIDSKSKSTVKPIIGADNMRFIKSYAKFHKDMDEILLDNQKRELMAECVKMHSHITEVAEIAYKDNDKENDTIEHDPRNSYEIIKECLKMKTVEDTYVTFIDKYKEKTPEIINTTIKVIKNEEIVKNIATDKNDKKLKLEEITEKYKDKLKDISDPEKFIKEVYDYQGPKNRKIKKKCIVTTRDGKNLFNRSLTEIHNELSFMNRKLVDENKDLTPFYPEEIKNMQQSYKMPDGSKISFKIHESSFDVINSSTQLSNCLGYSHINDIIDGDRWTLYMEDETRKRVAAIELIKNKDNYCVTQFQGPHDNIIDPKYVNVATRWLQNNNIQSDLCNDVQRFGETGSVYGSMDADFHNSEIDFAENVIVSVGEMKKIQALRLQHANELFPDGFKDVPKNPFDEKFDEKHNNHIIDMTEIVESETEHEFETEHDSP